jgi:hypothetical protein
MMTGYEAYSLFNSLKLHFSTDSYDFFKYGGKSKVSVDAFENRKDKYFFYKLSRRLQDKDELTNFLVANFLHDENCWVGNLLDEVSEIRYRERQKVLQSISYSFQNDCEKIFDHVENPNDVLQSEDGDYPKLLTSTLQKVTEIETLCIMNSLMNFLPQWDKRIADTIRWPQYKRKIIKYTPFIKFDNDKCKQILKRVIHEKVENIS